MNMTITVAWLVIFLWARLTVYLEATDWYLQNRITISNETGTTYGVTPSALFGRGFITLVTGYNSTSPGIYVHTNDDGHVDGDKYVWKEQAKLVGDDTEVGDQFGFFLVADHFTIITSAPAANSYTGSVYVFNGTLRHWAQVQKLTGDSVGEYFGEHMSLDNNTLVIGAKSAVYTFTALSTAGSFTVTHQIIGAVYVYTRTPGQLLWNLQAKLIPDYLQEPGQDTGVRVNKFGRKVAVKGNTLVASAENGGYYGSSTGSVYVFQSTIYC